MYNWIFGTEVGVDPNSKKNSLSGHVDFFNYLEKKSQVLTFGMDLEAISKFQIFGYLDVWMEKTITTVTQSQLADKMHQEEFILKQNVVDKIFCSSSSTNW